MVNKVKQEQGSYPTAFVDEMIVELIAVYRNEPKLWDVTDPDYKDRNLQYKLRQKVLKVLQMQGHTNWIQYNEMQMSKKWASLKASYLKGKRESPPSGSGAESLSAMKWKWSEHLLFLDEGGTVDTSGMESSFTAMDKDIAEVDNEEDEEDITVTYEGGVRKKIKEDTDKPAPTFDREKLGLERSKYRQMTPKQRRTMKVEESIKGSNEGFGNLVSVVEKIAGANTVVAKDPVCNDPKTMSPFEKMATDVGSLLTNRLMFIYGIDPSAAYTEYQKV